jgi:CubicO group peptidase (beta-lactamase class C family)
MFTQQRELAEVPAMAAGIVLNGSIVAFTGHNAGENSLFRIASMTKSFTAAATLILRDEGRVLLDSPIVAYAPEFHSLRGPTEDSAPITLRQLLTMSTGLVTDDPWGDRHLDISDEDLDRTVQGNPCFANVPENEFEYSNLGYAIIGRIIHRVTGMRPQTFITERLLAPLEMHHTVWESSQAPQGTDVVVGMRADGITPETAPLNGGLATMGGLWSTVSDLAKWVHFFTDAFPARDDADASPLRRSSRREMQRIHTFVAPSSSTSSDGTPFNAPGGYGMGLLMHHHPQLGEVAGHSGGLPGYGSNMRWIKGAGYGVIALGNATYTPMANATRRVLDALCAAKVVRAPTLKTSAALGAAGKSLFDLLLAWDDEKARILFEDNVFPDTPLSELRRDAEEFVAKHGSLRLGRIDAEKLTAATIVAQSPTTEVHITFSLAPSGRIQEYELPKDFT